MIMLLSIASHLEAFSLLGCRTIEAAREETLHKHNTLIGC